jgi:hypothetical protein
MCGQLVFSIEKELPFFPRENDNLVFDDDSLSVSSSDFDVTRQMANVTLEWEIDDDCDWVNAFDVLIDNGWTYRYGYGVSEDALIEAG